MTDPLDLDPHPPGDTSKPVEPRHASQTPETAHTSNSAGPHATDTIPRLLNSPCHRPLPAADMHHSRLNIMTLNCRGLVYNKETVVTVIDTLAPNVMFLTETKLVSNHNRRPPVTRLLRNYQWGMSSTTRKAAKKQ